MMRKIEESVHSEYFIRLMVRTLWSIEPTAVPTDMLREGFHELNYSARRGAIFLLCGPMNVPPPVLVASVLDDLVGVSTTPLCLEGGGARCLTVWLLLRERASRELQEVVLSFV
jgi:hypothetical protein